MGSTAWWQVEWVWMVTGWVLCALGVWVLVWALLWDRAKGRKRCPKCWYDMGGAVAVEREGRREWVCPECGKTGRSAGSLSTTRRRYWPACAGFVLLSLGTQFSMFGTAGRRGVQGMIPTGVLLVCVDEYWSQSPMSMALVERLQSGLVMPWDRRLAAWLELRRTPIDWESAILHRTKWPVDVPLRVQLIRPKGSWSCFDYRDVVLKWMDGKADEASASCSPPHIHGFYTSSPPDWIVLPAPKLGDNEFHFRVSIRGTAGFERTRNTTIHIQGVPSVLEVVPPAEGEAIVDEVRTHLAWGVGESRGGCGVIITQGDVWTPAARDTAYAMKFELIQDGRVLGADETDDFWWKGGFITCGESYDDTGAPRMLPVGQWTLRVTPAPIRALDQLGKTRSWSGRIEVPLRSLPWMVFDRTWDSSKLDFLPVDDRAQRELAKGLTPIK